MAERVSSDARYFVAHTKPHAEHYATDFLSNFKPYGDRRFQVYYPKVKVSRRHAGKTTIVDRPFLSRVLFILDDGRGTDAIRNAPGIASLMRFGETIVRVAQDVIDHIKSREVDGYVQLEQSIHFGPDPIQGDPVMVRKLILHKEVLFDAIFQHKVSEDRAIVFMRSMGALRRTEISMQDLV